MTTLRRIVRLPARDRRLLLLAFSTTAIVRVAQSMLPFRVLHGWAERQRIRTRTDESRERIAWAVTVAGRRVPRSNCLTEAIAASILLRGRGLPSSVRLGVTRTAGRLEAHAWTESGDEIVVGEAEAVRFRAFPRPTVPHE